MGYMGNLYEGVEGDFVVVFIYFFLSQCINFIMYHNPYIFFYFIFFHLFLRKPISEPKIPQFLRSPD